MRAEGFFFGKLEAEANKETAKAYDVTGYPTLLYFTNFGKKKIPYESGTGRSYDAI
jgi:thioredoxin-related protein